MRRAGLSSALVHGMDNMNSFSFAFKVLEYTLWLIHQPKNQSWVTIGNLEEIRGEGHAVLSIGPQDVLDCLAGKKPLEMNQKNLFSLFSRIFSSINFSSQTKNCCEGAPMEPVD